MQDQWVQPTYYFCNTCGKILKVLNDTDSPIFCCGKEMEILIDECTEDEKNLMLPSCCDKKRKPMWLCCLPVVVLVTAGIIYITRSKKN